jgi:hypothetical protein
MNDNDGENQPPSLRTLRIASALRFWAEQGLDAGQMRAKLDLQYPGATPNELEHATLLAQVQIIAEGEA